MNGIKERTGQFAAPAKPEPDSVGCGSSPWSAYSTRFNDQQASERQRLKLKQTKNHSGQGLTPILALNITIAIDYTDKGLDSRGRLWFSLFDCRSFHPA